jgi:superfamily II DNA or RNA helicase
MSRRNLVTDSTMVNTWGATPRASFGARFIKVKAPERPSGGSEKMLSEASRSRIQLLKDRLQEIEREAEAIRNEIETLNNATDYPKFRDAITLSSREKIALYQTLFFNRTDVFPKAWQSDKGSGWTPVCANEWKPGLCSKKLVKCHACANRLFVTLENTTLLEHFHGKIRIGMYAIDSESKCLFLATDFDGATWLSDVVAFRAAAASLGVDVATERSNSGNGGHCWIFFAERVQAKVARKLGFLILERATQNSPLGSFKSYDRFFPNQDEVPDGGFGNLIALPFFGPAKSLGNTVFINENGLEIENQWAYLSGVTRLSGSELTRILNENQPQIPVPLELDPEFHHDNTMRGKGIGRKASSVRFSGEFESTITNTLNIETAGLPSRIVLELKKLVTFANPAFFENLRLRRDNWNTPRYISKGEMRGSMMCLPRGVRERAEELLLRAGGTWKCIDGRKPSSPLESKIAFSAILREDQKLASEALLQTDYGILVAPTGTGKTVIGCAIIANLSLPTLVLCHRKQIAEQWKARLLEFTNLTNNQVGILASAKKKTTGIVDIALFQSLVTNANIAEFLDQYALVIVDECHHVPAISFEEVLGQIHSGRIYGLTATPRREDGLHPIMEMQCGPIRHTMAEPIHKKALARHLFKRDFDCSYPPLPVIDSVHELWEALTNCQQRRNQIVADIRSLIEAGRRTLVVSERKEHLKAIYDLVVEQTGSSSIFMLTGDAGIKIRREILSNFDGAIREKSGCALFATGSLVGEGVDIPAIDALILAFPISSRVKMTQYLGRIERESPGKFSVIAVDYEDVTHPITRSMFKKRASAYRTLNYAVAESLEAALHPESLNTHQHKA